MSVFVSLDHSQVYEINSPRSGKHEGIHSKILDECLTAKSTLLQLQVNTLQEVPILCFQTDIQTTQFLKQKTAR